MEEKELIEAIVKFSVEHMSGWDFIIAFVIVLFDEYPIKTWIFKKDEKYKVLYKVVPIVLGVIGYLVYALITKSPWYMGLYHGAIVGLASMGCYDVILKTGKKKGLDGIKDMNKAIEEEIKK